MGGNSRRVLRQRHPRRCDRAVRKDCNEGMVSQPLCLLSLVWSAMNRRPAHTRFVAAAYHTGEQCQCKGKGCPNTCGALAELNRHIKVTGKIVFCFSPILCKYCSQLICNLSRCMPPQPCLVSSPATSSLSARSFPTAALHSALRCRHHVLSHPGRCTPSAVLCRGGAKPILPEKHTAPPCRQKQQHTMSYTLGVF